jgi:arylsulfatase A-like enzyme
MKTVERDAGNMKQMPGLFSGMGYIQAALMSLFGPARLSLLLGALVLSAGAPAGAASGQTNILFIIMDDVGIDQLSFFNPKATNAISTPNINTLIHHGVAFNNCWMMPECSPSRSCFFTGRYPLRTGVTAAILDYNLPSAQVSPYEVTTPRILAQAGYRSALVGKYHLGGPANNPDGIRTPASLGWDYFNGNLHGGPPFIDPTLGGQTTNATRYPCGFPTGNQRGVCWFQGPGNQIHCDNNSGAGYTGHDCVTLGGIPALTASGDFARFVAEATIEPDFTVNNGYYAWPQVINDGPATNSSINRQYMSMFNTDTALQWIHRQSQANQPWMCTVSYNCIHTPYQQPPTNLYPPGFTWPAGVPEGNTNESQIKIISDLMLYGLDQEIGRLLVGIGLASRLPFGQLDYHPENTDTMVVLVGDNGTYYPSVNLPYDPLRAKATLYQTGVCAPMVVAGPQVVAPGRTVTNMVNAVDLFALFGEIAGLQVRSLVPASHILDCQPVMPYLVNPAQTSLRQFNFSQIGDGVKAPSVQLWPCVFTIAGQKVGNDHLFNTQALCEDAGGEWFGPPVTTNYPTCCDVRSYVYTNLSIIPAQSWAVRDDHYKLVYSILASCDTNNPYEFYDLQPSTLNPVGLDTMFDDLLASRLPLTPQESQHYTNLLAELVAIMNSEPVCYGDGNLDKVVNQEDLVGVLTYWGQPSVFDFNNDGTTDENDLAIVLANFGHNCVAVGADVVQFTCSQTISNALFRMWLTGPSGSNVVVEASVDHQAWAPIQTNVLSPTGLVLSVPLTNDHRFFRARLAP